MILLNNQLILPKLADTKFYCGWHKFRLRLEYGYEWSLLRCRGGVQYSCSLKVF